MEEGAKEEDGTYFAKSNRLGKTKIEALGEGRPPPCWSLDLEFVMSGQAST